MPDPRSREVSCRAATPGSFGRAAERLSMTRPGVSRRIAALERTFGVPLFERGARAVAVTAKGRARLGHADRFLRLHTEMIAAVSDPAATTGVLRLGASQTLVHAWPMRFIQAMSRTYPGVAVNLSVDVSPNVTRAFGGPVANRDVTIDVARGEIRGPIGPNGAGASTLFKSIGGLGRPRGRHGALRRRPPGRPARPPDHRPRHRLRAREQAAVPAPVGGRQRIMPKRVDEIFEAVTAIRESGVTVPLAEQRLAESLAIADRAYVLQTGRVILSGPAARVGDDPEVRRAYLGIRDRRARRERIGWRAWT